MELLFAGLYGLAIGLAAWPLLRPAGKVGPALVPAIGAATAIGWAVVASWLSRVDGFAWIAFDRAWVWVLLVLITAGVCIGLAITLPVRRAADDKDLLDRLSHVGRSRV
ncbi:MAG: hypothetical protein GXX90_07235 [Microbacteriaceae bacterium]|nr:hypothetical protein [Microbacteriaceae bacterium]